MATTRPGPTSRASSCCYPATAGGRGSLIPRGTASSPPSGTPSSALLLMYTITGLWKVGYAFHDLVARAEGRSLHPNGFSLILANRLLETNEPSLLGDGLLRHPVLGWLLFLGTMYLETASLLDRLPSSAVPDLGAGPHPVPRRHAGHDELHVLAQHRAGGPDGRVCAGRPRADGPPATVLDLPGVHLALRTLAPAPPSSPGTPAGDLLGLRARHRCPRTSLT